MKLNPLLNITFLKAALILCCFFFISCENTEEDLQKFSGDKTIAVEEGKEVKIIYTLGDKTSARLIAPLMLRHQTATPYIEFTKGVHADFFNDSLLVESKLSAHYAKYTETESKVFLRDSVVVFNVTGDTLFCTELYWDRNIPGSEFHTDKPVRIRTPSQIIDGDGLDAPQDFKSWHIINGRGKVRVPSGQFP